jgi:hypothetical protein
VQRKSPARDQANHLPVATRMTREQGVEFSAEIKLKKFHFARQSSR